MNISRQVIRIQNKNYKTEQKKKDRLKHFPRRQSEMERCIQEKDGANKTYKNPCQYTSFLQVYTLVLIKLFIL